MPSIKLTKRSLQLLPREFLEKIGKAPKPVKKRPAKAKVTRVINPETVDESFDNRHL